MPQLCNWVELFQCAGLEMVVWVVEWGCIFEMDVDGVVVGQVVEAKERDESCTGASTPDEVHSTEVVAEHKSETNEQMEEHGIVEDTTKEGVWTRKDEQGDPKKAWKWLDWGCNRSGCPLHSLLVRSGSMWPSLVHEIEWFSGAFGPLICSFNSGQGRALIRRMVFFTD